MSSEGEIESFLSAHRRVFTPRFEEGDVIGDWRMVAFIARGGTAEVYRAARVSDGQVAALKVLHKNDEVHRQRLAREAEFLRTHRHTAFPVLLDSRIGEDGPSYLVEEFLYPLELPRKDGAIAQLMLKLCAAVGYLHCCGLVHRDLKPSNIMTRREGGTDPVIIDFGLLRASVSAAVPRADSLTVENGRSVGVGTPGYGAPEQFIGGEVSASVDIHALGVIADRCFEECPSAAWEEIIRRATSSLPNLRYRTVASFARAIRRRHWLRTLVLWMAAATIVACGLLALTDMVSGWRDYGGVQLWENGPYWAECNVGAAKPEEYGHYFRWGDTVGCAFDGEKWKAVDGSLDGCMFVGTNCFTHGKGFAQLQQEGYVGSDGNLVAAHDAATANLGAPWRMPTRADLAALLENCTFEPGRRNGVCGWFVSGKGAYATRSIFLPASGYAEISDLCSSGSWGFVSSSTTESHSWYSYLLRLDFGGVKVDNNHRYRGRTVRAVRDVAR